MSEKTVSTSKEKDLSEASKNVKLFFKKNYLKKTELKKIQKRRTCRLFPWSQRNSLPNIRKRFEGS